MKPLCLADLRLALPRRHWSLLERLTLEEDAHETRLLCSVPDRGLVEAHLLPAARAYHESHSVRVVTRGAVGNAVPPVEAPSRPDWIPADQWTALPALMRTALAGSTRDADGGQRSQVRRVMRMAHCTAPRRRCTNCWKPAMPASW